MNWTLVKPVFGPMPNAKRTRPPPPFLGQAGCRIRRKSNKRSRRQVRRATSNQTESSIDSHLGGAWDMAGHSSIDHLDYEDLLAIGESLGDVKSCGLSQFEVDLIPFHRATAGEVIECSICLSNIGLGEYVMRLPCLHIFHCNCVRMWLVRRASCPVCRIIVPHPIIEIND